LPVAAHPLRSADLPLALCERRAHGELQFQRFGFELRFVHRRLGLDLGWRGFPRLDVVGRFRHGKCALPGLDVEQAFVAHLAQLAF
jgi:hypothetical protein